MSTQPTPIPAAQSVLSGAQQPSQTMPNPTASPDATIDQPIQTSLPAQTTQAIQAASPSHRAGSMFESILQGALTGMAGTDPSKGSGFLGGMGNGAAQEQQAEQQAAQQKAQQQHQQQMDAQSAQAATDAHNSSVQSTLYRNAQTQLSQANLHAAQSAAQAAGIKLGEGQAAQLNTMSGLMTSAPGTTSKDFSGPTKWHDAIASAGGAQGAAKEVAGTRTQYFQLPNGDVRVISGIPQDWASQRSTKPLPYTVVTGYEKDGTPIETTQMIPPGGITFGDYANLTRQQAATTLTTSASIANTAAKNAANIKKARIAASAKGQGANAAPALNSPEYKALVDSVANYKLDPSSLLRYGKAFQVKLLADAVQVNPSYDQTKYNAYNALEKSFTEGANSKKIQAFNAMIGHTYAAMQGVAALRNSGSPWINTPINKLKNQTGNPAVVQVLNQIMPARTQLLNFLNNDHALKQEEVAEGRKLMNENMSPAQFETAAKAFMHTGLIQLQAVNQTYKGVRKENWGNLLSPESQQALRNAGFGSDVDALTQQQGVKQNLSPQGQTITLRLPNGQTGNIPASQQASFMRRYPNAQVVK